MKHTVDSVREQFKRGDLVEAWTENSVCVGFIEGVYQMSDHAFINLAGTRKTEQGWGGEDWFDHVYSVRLDRIVDLNKGGSLIVRPQYKKSEP